MEQFKNWLLYNVENANDAIQVLRIINTYETRGHKPSTSNIVESSVDNTNESKQPNEEPMSPPNTDIPVGIPPELANLK